MDEAELVAALKRGEPAAMEALVESHADRLLRSAILLCGDHSQAEDLVQEVFIAVGNSINRFRGISIPPEASSVIKGTPLRSFHLPNI